MDGMSQAKFRAPRNISQSKDLTGRQRPHLHCVGAIVDGARSETVTLQRVGACVVSAVVVGARPETVTFGGSVLV